MTLRITDRHSPSRRKSDLLDRRASWIVRQPAERGKLDVLAGVTLWLTLTHGFAGTGIGFVLGLVLGPHGGSA